MVERLTGPRKISAHALAKEVGVGQPTLSLWLRAAGTLPGVTDEAKRPNEWSPQEKLAAVMEAAAVSEYELGVWLRQKGLTEEHLRQWRQALAERACAVFAPREPRASSESRKRVQELERELRRKDKALAETAALLVLQGKMQALWEDEDASTRQSSDELSSNTSRKRKPPERG